VSGTRADDPQRLKGSGWFPGTRAEIKHDNKTGRVVLDQIRTIYKQRILKDLGKLSKSEIKEVKAIIKETFVD